VNLENRESGESLFSAFFRVVKNLLVTALKTAIMKFYLALALASFASTDALSSKDIDDLKTVVQSSLEDWFKEKSCNSLPTCFESKDNVAAPAVSASGDYIPTVFMHGLGDSGGNRGMKNLAKTVSDTYPGAYSVAVKVADGISSYTENMDKQVKEFAEAVKADPNLADGFNAVGLSQGGLIVRAYVEQYNDPKVHNLVSLCGPQGGIGDCPKGTPSWMCSVGKDVMYSAGFSFSGYWKDTEGDADKAKAKYLDKSPYLADVNNDRDEKNDSYKQNMISLNKYVMVKALNDTVVAPKESEFHDFFPWGSTEDIEEYKSTEAYENDWIGLRSLDEAKKIDTYTYEGDHLRWSDDFWKDTVLPYLGDKFA